MGFQRHKWWGLLLLLVPLVGHTEVLAKDTIDYNVVDMVQKHSVSIAVYYTMSETEYNKRMAAPATRKWNVTEGNYFWRQLIVPVKSASPQGITTPVKCIAYIGSGTILRGNHVLSVQHLFAHEENTLSMVIWVFHESLDHPIQADVVAESGTKTDFFDYAIIKLKENLGLPGLKVAAPDSAKVGDQVIFTGSPGGIGYFTRFMQLTKFEWFLQTNEEGILTIRRYEEFPFWCVFPGGPGDSGGSIKNLKGEIISVLYCGIEIYAENYIFGNPTQKIWSFLQSVGLEALGK
jgi:S1-C subfamily serine protease